MQSSISTSIFHFLQLTYIESLFSVLFSTTIHHQQVKFKWISSRYLRGMQWRYICLYASTRMHLRFSLYVRTCMAYFDFDKTTCTSSFPCTLYSSHDINAEEKMKSYVWYDHICLFTFPVLFPKTYEMRFWSIHQIMHYVILETDCFLPNTKLPFTISVYACHKCKVPLLFKWQRKRFLVQGKHKSSFGIMWYVERIPQLSYLSLKIIISIVLILAKSNVYK